MTKMNIFSLLNLIKTLHYPPKESIFQLQILALIFYLGFSIFSNSA